MILICQIRRYRGLKVQVKSRDIEAHVENQKAMHKEFADLKSKKESYEDAIERASMHHREGRRPNGQGHDVFERAF